MRSRNASFAKRSLSMDRKDKAEAPFPPRAFDHMAKEKYPETLRLFLWCSLGHYTNEAAHRQARLYTGPKFFNGHPCSTALPLDPTTAARTSKFALDVDDVMALSPSSPQDSSSAQHELLGALSALHHGGKYSDLKVVCNHRQWNVHKAIVCPRSGFFDGACSHQFREANTGVIDLSDDDEEAIDQMIHYLYHLDYLNQQELDQEPSAMFRHRAYSDTRRKVTPKIDFTKIEDPLLSQAGLYDSQVSTAPPSSPHREDGSNHNKSSCSPTATRSETPPLEADEGSDEEDYETTESESHLILHTQVYALAEKYDIPDLKILAKRKFEIAVACYYDAPELAEAIELVYSSTVDSDRGLRAVVLQLFKLHPLLVNTQDILAVIKETPTLALDLWKVERGLL